MLVCMTFLSQRAFGQEIQIEEPEYIGEALILNDEGNFISTDNEIAAIHVGASLKVNSWNAISLVVEGGKAAARVTEGHPITLVVKAVDNQTNPLSIVRIYKLDGKKKKRSTILAKDNSDNIMTSKTYTKNQLKFTGKKYGTASYVITLNDVKPGEYGIVVSNPNNVDETRMVVACFGVDKAQ